MEKMKTIKPNLHFSNKIPNLKLLIKNLNQKDKFHTHHMFKNMQNKIYFYNKKFVN